MWKDISSNEKGYLEVRWIVHSDTRGCLESREMDGFFAIMPLLFNRSVLSNEEGGRAFSRKSEVKQ